MLCLLESIDDPVGRNWGQVTHPTYSVTIRTVLARKHVVKALGVVPLGVHIPRDRYYTNLSVRRNRAPG